MADTDEPGHRLRATSAWNLVVFGVSVVIGAGIFTLTVQTFADKAGPAISLSFLLAAATCALGGVVLRAEFASTVPVAGSAYTFGYATLGEFLAWILGWDLILEFAVGAAVVGGRDGRCISSTPWGRRCELQTRSAARDDRPGAGDDGLGAIPHRRGRHDAVGPRHPLVVVVQRHHHRDQGRRGRAGDCRRLFHIKGDNFSSFIPPSEVVRASTSRWI